MLTYKQIGKLWGHDDQVYMLRRTSAYLAFFIITIFLSIELFLDNGFTTCILEQGALGVFIYYKITLITLVLHFLYCDISRGQGGSPLFDIYY